MISNLPINHLAVSNCRINAPQWVLLYDLVKSNPINGISIFDDLHMGAIDVKETMEGVLDIFWFARYYTSSKRLTFCDSYGLIGMSSINLQDDEVYLTEGVSDFISMKLCYPNKNVVGFTTLSGNSTAKSIVLSLFNRAVIFSDNDTDKEKNTGIANALHIKTCFETYNKKAIIQVPEYPFKDVTQLFISILQHQ